MKTTRILKKINSIIFLICSITTTTISADIQWTTASSHIIPNDGQTYYIDSVETLTATFTVNGTLELHSTGSLITGNSDLIIGDGAAGTLTIKDGGTLDINLGGTVEVGKTNAGTINISGGEISMQTTGVCSISKSALGIINLNSGTFNLNSGILEVGYSQYGQLNQYAGTAFTMNGGEIHIGVNLNSGFAQHPYIKTYSGATFNQNGGIIKTTLASTNFSNYGRFIVGGVYNFNNGTFLNGNINIGHQYTAILIDASGVFNHNEGTLSNSNAGYANVIIYGTYNFYSGTINNGTSGIFATFSEEIGSKFNMFGGTFNSGTGGANNSHVPLFGETNITGGTINNACINNISGGMQVKYGGTCNYSNCTINNTAGSMAVNGTLNIGPGTNYILSGGELACHGIINVTGGTLTVQNGRYLVNTNTINISSGTINLNYGYLLNGGYSEGTINMSGGTINLSHASSEIRNGSDGISTSKPGIINITGGTINHSNGIMRNTHVREGTINFSGGTYNLTGGTFYNTGIHDETYYDAYLNVYDNAIFNVAGGTLQNGGSSIKYNRSRINIYGNASFKLSSGTITQYGCPYIPDYNSSTVNIYGNGSLFISGGTFNNTTNGNTSALYITENGTLDIYGGTFNNTTDGTSEARISVSAGHFNVSGGTLANGSGTNDISFFSTSMNFSSDNTFEIPTGQTVTVPSGSGLIVGQTYNFTSASGSTLSVSNGSSFGIGGTFFTPGTYSLWGRNVTLSGNTLTFTSGNTITVPNGSTFTIGNDGTLDIALGGALVVGTGASFAYEGSMSTTGDATLWGTYVSGSGTTLTITSGNTVTVPNTSSLGVGGSSTLTVNSGAELVLDTGSSFSFGGSVGGAGDITFWNVPVTASGTTITVTSGNSFNVPASSHLYVASGNTFAFGNGSSLVFNGGMSADGVFSLWGGPAYFFLNTLTVTSGNTVTIPNSSTLTLPVNKTLTVNSGGTFALDTGSSFVFNGSLGGDGTYTFWNNPVTVTSSSITVTTGNAFAQPSSSTLTIGANNSLICDVGTTFSFVGGNLVNNGSFDLWGSTNKLDFSGNSLSIKANETFGIANNSTLIIAPNNSFSIPENSTVHISPDSSLINRAPNSVEINGDLYVYGTLENGDVGSAGTININYPGDLYLLGGSLENKHANSIINIYSGGKLYNYYGTVDIALGDIDLKTGGLYNNVRGNNPGTFTIASASLFSENTDIFLNDDLDIDYTWTITEKNTIYGNGHKVTLGTNGALLVNENASLKLENLIVKNVSGNKIACTDDTSTITLSNVTFIQDASYSFTKGKLYISDALIIQGANTSFCYESNQTSTIAKNTTVLFDYLVTFSYNASENNNIKMINKSSTIYCNHAIIYAQNNFRLTKGSILLDNAATLKANTYKTLYFGNSSLGSDYDVDIDLYSGAAVEIEGNVTVDNVNA